MGALAPLVLNPSSEQKPVLALVAAGQPRLKIVLRAPENTVLEGPGEYKEKSIYIRYCDKKYFRASCNDFSLGHAPSAPLVVRVRLQRYRRPARTSHAGM
jgi:hypothetical protein